LADAPRADAGPHDCEDSAATDACEDSTATDAYEARLRRNRRFGIGIASLVLGLVGAAACGLARWLAPAEASMGERIVVALIGASMLALASNGARILSLKAPAESDRDFVDTENHLNLLSRQP
jgi:uncharacterized membrane protein YeaQ/YmgE (transglycosylase-associated protein family)